MYCTKCGKQIEDGSRFCEFCGASLTNDSQETQGVQSVPPQIKTLGEQTIIHSGKANHFKNIEAVGGNLYLFADKLRFKSHSINIQNHELIINLNQIKEVSFFNSLGLVPNGLAIKTIDGKTEKFVVNGRKVWKNEIDKCLINKR
jgi:hypothetical protein